MRKIKYGVYAGKRVWEVKIVSNILADSRVVAGGIVATGILLDSLTLKMGPIVYLEKSVRSYHYLLRDNPEERSFHARFW